MLVLMPIFVLLVSSRSIISIRIPPTHIIMQSIIIFTHYRLYFMYSPSLPPISFRFFNVIRSISFMCMCENVVLCEELDLPKRDNSRAQALFLLGSLFGSLMCRFLSSFFLFVVVPHIISLFSCARPRLSWSMPNIGHPTIHILPHIDHQSYHSGH